MNWLLLYSTFYVAVVPGIAWATDAVVSILPDGTLSIQGSAEIPPYAEGGRWQETDPRATDRFVCRHYLFVISGQPPAMEVFVTTDHANDPPDGVFEQSMIRGYLASFSKGIGFRYDVPTFADIIIGPEHVSSCRVELANEKRKIWLYAYVYRRSPSLVFLTVRPLGDENRNIEDYLAKVRLK